MLPPPPHNFILFELDFYVEFPLLRLILFLIDLKSTIITLCLGQTVLNKGCILGTLHPWFSWIVFNCNWGISTSLNAKKLYFQSQGEKNLLRS